MRELKHLSDIYKSYDTFIIDLWGVIHNGIRPNPKAIKAVEHLHKNSKKIVFLSNAPRPANEVKKFLLKMKIDEKYLSNLVTSGGAAMKDINKNKFGTTFFHLGPNRDRFIYEKIKDKKKDIQNCDFILCTGLFDEEVESLDGYKKLLEKATSKKFICTNPDLTVHRGDHEEFCAGAVAKLFEELGGKVIYYGKPYKEIYKSCFKSGERVLAIGDNLRTDIKGANNLNLDSIFITYGVHRDEVDTSELDKLFKNFKVKANYFQRELQW